MGGVKAWLLLAAVVLVSLVAGISAAGMPDDISVRKLQQFTAPPTTSGTNGTATSTVPPPPTPPPPTPPPPPPTKPKKKKGQLMSLLMPPPPLLAMRLRLRLTTKVRRTASTGTTLRASW